MVHYNVLRQTWCNSIGKSSLVVCFGTRKIVLYVILQRTAPAPVAATYSMLRRHVVLQLDHYYIAVVFQSPKVEYYSRFIILRQARPASHRARPMRAICQSSFHYYSGTPSRYMANPVEHKPTRINHHRVHYIVHSVPTMYVCMTVHWRIL